MRDIAVSSTEQAVKNYGLFRTASQNASQRLAYPRPRRGWEKCGSGWQDTQVQFTRPPGVHTTGASSLRAAKTAPARREVWGCGGVGLAPHRVGVWGCGGEKLRRWHYWVRDTHRAMAFARGCHPQLGTESQAFELEAGVVQMILDRV